MKSNIEPHKFWPLCQMLLLKQNKFFGGLSSYTRFQKGDPKIFETTAIDGNGVIYYNEEWTNNLTIEDGIFEVAHELGHLVFDTLTRGNVPGIDHKLFNLASDYHIDTHLIESNLTQSEVSKKMVPPEIQNMVKRNKLIEVTYGALKKKNDEQPQSDKNKRKCVGIIDTGDGGDGDSNKDAPMKAAAMTDDQKMKWTKAIMAVAAQVKGDVPGPIRELLDAFKRPSVSWVDYVRYAIKETFKDRYSWKIPSRRGAAMNLRLPSPIRSDKVIMASLDTSGSISNELLQKFLTELYGIAHCSGVKKVIVALHHCNVYGWFTLEKHNKFTAEVKSGGTSHKEVFESFTNPRHPMFKSLRDVGMLICLTDLYSDQDTIRKPNVPVIWATLSEYSNNKIPFGKKVIIR